ncbi:hypothetical protein [Bosea caraganae]|uniref:hypothetical protein n=1 Tax=Bosea caraganae TaxID=2763117 RepID=UPI0011C0241F|nr:hypothetical protein [Bosea caraganae]
MPNAHVAAAATGLPAAIFNRRRMLLGLAAASTAAAAPIAVVAATDELPENTALLNLGNGTSALLEASAEEAAALPLP